MSDTVGIRMTPEEIQARAYREGAPCGTCPHCVHYKDGQVRWRECRQPDASKCRAVIYKTRRKG